MKIVCDSCGAKYSIADEKVAGRVFKIRCKKCGAPIVVRGDQVQSAAEESTKVVEYSGDQVWHVVVDGDQQGPFAKTKLGSMLNEGGIGWDAFVWREGFEDWKPAQDVTELVDAFSQGAAAAGMPEGDDRPDPFAAADDPGGGLFAGADDAAAGSSSPSGPDLFASSPAQPFGGGDDGVVASSPTPRPAASADQALTGARNENSVLFSLSNLQALATGGDEAPAGAPGAPGAPGAAPSAAPAPARAGHAAGEGSGLIDIRALAAATTATSTGSGPVTSADDAKVDDLLSIGGPSTGLSSLGAPVIVPETRDDRRGSGMGIGLGIGFGALALAAAAVAVAFIVFRPADNTGQAGVITPPPTNAPTAPPTAPAGNATPSGEGTPSGETAAAATEGDDGDDDEAEGDSTSTRRRSGRRRPRSTSGSADSRESEPAPTKATSRRRQPSQDDDLLSLIDRATGETASRPSRRQRPERTTNNDRATPTRSDVQSAMSGVQGAVQACGNGTSGTARVRVVFQGRSGRVTNATVDAAQLPPPVRSCIARAVRGASLQPFSNPTFSVTYPFRL